ncbi:UNVERIFIED_CONTAM: hypothetical protein GTU68_032702 [Idotea baltica]|nr:hypothetical protein [Idotea baltica]
MYYCEFCEYKSNNSKNLKTHTFLHTGERPFPCTLCPARYIKKVDLENHTRIHTGERPFKCPTCSLTFRVKDHLKKHLNKKFKCVKKSDQGLLPEN